MFVICYSFFDRIGCLGKVCQVEVNKRSWIDVSFYVRTSPVKKQTFSDYSIIELFSYIIGNCGIFTGKVVAIWKNAIILCSRRQRTKIVFESVFIVISKNIDRND